MLAGDMLRAVVPVYPPEGCSFVRSGSLAGEPSPKVPEEVRVANDCRREGTANSGPVWQVTAGERLVAICQV